MGSSSLRTAREFSVLDLTINVYGAQITIDSDSHVHEPPLNDHLKNFKDIRLAQLTKIKEQLTKIKETLESDTGCKRKREQLSADFLEVE